MLWLPMPTTSQWCYRQASSGLSMSSTSVLLFQKHIVAGEGGRGKWTNEVIVVVGDGYFCPVHNPEWTDYSLHR